MARSTFRRTPLQNDVDFDDLNGGFFRYTKFGGLCDNRNDAVIDQETFADCKNVFVDTNELLTSRPPFKFLDDEAYIVKKWVFGEYTLQFHRVPIDADGNRVDSSADLEDISFLFILRCISHDTIDDAANGAYGALAWQIDASDLGWDNMPKIKPVQIEDKIYFWFAGVSFVCFNTAGRKSIADEADDTLYPYFEDAMKYIYLPIFTLVINGIESELESLNYLTNTYRKRYIYSALSSVNFASLVGKHLSVGLNGPNTQSTSKHLYDIVANSANFSKTLIYPRSEIGSSYYTTMVKTPNSNVYLRYIFGTSLIEVSFDGSYYRSLPALEDIIAEPIITEDGLYVVAFTATRVAKCRLVAQESTDFTDTNNILLWEYSLYWEGQRESIRIYNARGVFPTIDNCAWICESGTQHVHVQWLRGTEDIVVYEESDTDSLRRNPAVMAYQYITPTTDNPNIGPIIAGLFYDDPGYVYVGLLSYNNASSIQWLRVSHIRENITVDGVDYAYDSIPIPVDNFDIRFYNYVIDSTTININLSIAFSARYISADGDIVDKDILYNFNVNTSSSFKYTIMADLSEQFGDGIRVRSILNPSDDTKIWLHIGKIGSDGTLAKIAEFNTQTSEITVLRELPDSDNHTMPGLAASSNVLYCFGALAWNANGVFSGATARSYYVTASNATNIGSLPIATGDSICNPSGNNYYIRGGRRSGDNNWNENIFIFNNNTDEFSQSDRTVADAQMFGTVRLGHSFYVTSDAPKTIYKGVSDLASVNYTYTGTFDLDHRIWVTSVDGTCIYLFPTLESTDRVVLRINFDRDNITGIDSLGNLPNGIIGFEKTLVHANSNIGDVIYAFSGVNGVDNTNLYRIIFPNTLYVDESSETYKVIGENSVLLKLSQSVNDVVLTDSYLWYADESLAIPTPEISKNILGFGDRVALINDASVGRKYVGNVYKLSNTTASADIVFGNIVSGDSVYYDYAGYSLYDIYYADNDKRKTILKLRVSSNGEWESITGGDIRAGDIVTIGNVSQLRPTGWSTGDDWPEALTKQGIFPPLIIDNGQVRSWRAGDAWPGNASNLYTWPLMGYVDIAIKSIPLYVDDAGVYYNIDGTIWTSDIGSDTDNQLEIDEVINAEYDENGNISDIGFNNNLPDYYGSFNDYFISFVDIDTGYNLLEITSTRREESQLDAYRTDFLFYLPINSEERFSEKITNIHPIADTAIGIFTETSIYYMSSVQLDSGLSYSKPVKSKIPLGVREGDDVITALDGQVILFATKRGIASMTPQDFIASTERTLVYLSDAIQNRYEKFYNQSVKSASLIPNEFDTGYKCMIKICTYRYWLLFYRYMDNQILAYDTRYNAWWIWTTPYPIRELIVTSRLEALLQIDFNPVDNSQIILPPNKFPLMGVRYLWTDDEVDLDADVSGAFPTLTYEYEANESYYDDVIEGALNGDSELIYDNKFAGSRRQLSYASPTIEWSITSQRLHFNALNNYKLIQAIYMTAKGVDNMTATLSTKAYRDAYHPESSIVFQMRINDLRTFLKRMNLMHTQFFQFMLSNDSNQETQRHLKLDSISIRYEVKGVIR